jgi:hypothetical protein
MMFAKGHTVNDSSNRFSHPGFPELRNSALETRNFDTAHFSYIFIEHFARCVTDRTQRHQSTQRAKFPDAGQVAFALCFSELCR